MTPIHPYRPCRSDLPLFLTIALLVPVLAVLPVAHAAAKLAASVGHVAPNFSRLDLNHQKVDVSAYRGKVVLLNFWATWCGPCLVEIPRFVEWQKEFGGQGLQIIGVSMDDSEAPVRTAYEKYKLNYPVVMGDARLGELYGGIFGLPVTFLIDRQGKIRFRHHGAVDIHALQGEIQTLLRES